MKSDHALFVDFGSTFTKIVLADLGAKSYLGESKARLPWRPISRLV